MGYQTEILADGNAQFVPSGIGSEWRNKQMYNQYLSLLNHFNETNPAFADELNQNMIRQYDVKGGTQPMLDSFENIRNGGMGGYSEEQYNQLVGGVSPVDGGQTAFKGAMGAGNEIGAGAGAGAIAGQVGDTATGIADTLQDPNNDNVQKGLKTGQKVASGLGALGIGGAAVPVIGAGLAVGGAIYDYNKNQKAELAMENAIREQTARRDIASAKYNKELDNDYARRELAMRGQTQGLPMYQAMMAQAGKNYATQNQVNTDMLEKGGMANKSGMAGQMASQNFNNLSKNVAKATKDTASSLKKAYGGLQGLAVSSAPENASYGMANKMYNESNNFGENLRPITNIAGAYGKKKAHDSGLGYLYEDYEENVNKGGLK